MQHRGFTSPRASTPLCAFTPYCGSMPSEGVTTLRGFTPPRAFTPCCGSTPSEGLTPPRRSTPHRGFTLIELMVTIVILAILAAIAYPSYSAYVIRANRTDATSALIRAAQAMQRCYSQGGTFNYVPCAPASSTTPYTTSANGYYTIYAAPLPTAPTDTALSTFTLTATPAKAPQTKDTQCAKFTLDSVGNQAAFTSAGASNTTVCWPSN